MPNQFEHMDEPRVLIRVFASFLAGVVCAALGCGLMILLFPIARRISDFGMGPFAGFLWLELAAAISGISGFMLGWRMMKSKKK